MQVREIQALNREIAGVVSYEQSFGQDDDAFERAMNQRVVVATRVPFLLGVLGTARVRRI